MAELVLTVSGRHLALPQNVPEQITNTEFIDAVRFECDSQYNGYELVAVFKNGEHGTPYPVAVPHDRSAVSIDPRALRRKGWLYVGMYGLDDLKVLPTLWAPAIEIKDGTDTSGTENPDEPVPSVYAALVARVSALEETVGDLETTVDTLEETVDDLETTVDTLEETVDDLETTVDQLADAVDEIEGDVADLQTSKQDVIPDLATIRSGAALGATALQSVPMATQNVIGGGKVNTVQGIGIKADGTFYAESASNANITNRNNGFRPIVSTNMDLAFRTCITAPSQELTDNQKEEACATIGAEYVGAYMKKYAENTLTESASYLEVSQNIYGEPLSLSDDYIVMIKIPEHGGSGNKSVRLYTNGTGFRSVGNAYFPSDKSVLGFRLLRNALSVEYLSPISTGSLASWFNMGDYFGNNIWGEGYRERFTDAESFGVGAASEELLPAGTKIQVFTMQTD